MSSNQLDDWWRQFVGLCAQLRYLNYPETILTALVRDLTSVEITLLYSVGKRSWVSALPKEDRMKKDDQHPIKIKGYAVHLMFPVAVSVGENLPNIDTVTFHVGHWFFFVECSRLSDQQITVMLNILHIKLVEYALAGYSNPIHLLQEDAQEVLKYLQCYRPRQLDEGQGVRGALIKIDGQGEVIGKRKKYLPTKRIRKAYCRRLFESVMSIHAIQDFLLRQDVRNDLEERFLCNFSRSDLPPFHVGWVRYNGLYNQFGYFNSEKNYGNAIQMLTNAKAKDFDCELPFTAVPLEVSIPLFAYNLFSIIKHFITGYPSRISPTESFIEIRKKKSKLIFMTLSGRANEEIAKAYCGMFSQYEYDPRCGGGQLPPELAEIYPTRVHDGVVILKSKYKHYQLFEESDLLRDACCLCLNAQFDQMPNEISLRIDNAPNKDTLVKIHSIITGMIKGFVADLQRRYEKMIHDYSVQCAKEMAEKFDGLYGAACKALKIQTDFCGKKFFEENLEWRRDFSWEDVKYFSSFLNTYFRELKTEPYYKSAAEREWFELNKPRITMVSGSEAVDKAYILFQESSRSYKKKIEFDTITRVKDAKFVMGKCPNQYIYLFAAVRSFCMYLNNINRAEFAQKLFQWTYQVLTDLSKQSVDILGVLSQYLSKKLEEVMIICCRTAQKGEISGWYDNKKRLIYLPYENYYHDFLEYWNDTYKYTFPYTQEKFQKELLEKQVLVVHESQRKGSYSRCQCRIVVDPPKDGQPSEQRPVLKIDIGKLTLSDKAEQELKEMDKITVRRRRESKKNKHTE